MQYFREACLSSAAFAAVFLLPGCAVLTLLRRPARALHPIPGLIAAFALSLCVTAVVGYGYFIRLCAFPSAVGIIGAWALAGAVAVVGRGFESRRRWKRAVAVFRDPLVAIGAAIFALSLILVMAKREYIYLDHIFHIAGIRKIAASSYYWPFQTWARYQFPPILPYRYPLLHFSVAAVCRLSRLDPIVVSGAVPAGFFLISTGVSYTLALLLSSSKRFALGTAACFCLIFCFIYRCRLWAEILLPRNFSDAILLPLLLSLYLLLLRQKARRAFFPVVVFSILAAAQLAIHGSHLIYFMLIAVFYAVLSRIMLKQRIALQPVLCAIALLLVLAAPLALGMSELVKTSSAREMYEIDKAYFLNRRARINGNSIERLGRTDHVIVKPSIVFNQFAWLGWLYAFFLLFRKRIPPVDVYCLAIALCLLLVQFNPLAIYILAPALSFPGVYRMFILMPVPIVVARLGVSLYEGLFRRRGSGGYLPGKFPPALLAASAAVAFLYPKLIVPAFQRYFPPIQLWVMPAVAFGMIAVFIVRLLRHTFPPFETGEQPCPGRIFRPAHLVFILALLAPHLLYVIRNTVRGEFSFFRPSVSLLRDSPTIGYLNQHCPGRPVFLADNPPSTNMLPTYADIFLLQGWISASPSLERFARERGAVEAQIFAAPPGQAPDYASIVSDRGRYELLADRHVRYLLFSDIRKQSALFREYTASPYFQTVWQEGNSAIMSVLARPPGTGPASEEQARILEEYDLDYAESFFPALVWYPDDRRVLRNPPGCWLQPPGIVERLIASRERLDRLGIEIVPTEFPSEITVSCGGEERTFAFADLSPQRWTFAPAALPEFLRRICGEEYYLYGLRASSGEGRKFFIRMYVTEDQIERRISGSRPFPLRLPAPGVREALENDEAFAGWFRSYFRDDPSWWLEKYSRLFECEALCRRTGREESDPSASGRAVRRYDPLRDRPGCLVFGPYAFLPAQPWVATFRLKVPGRAAGPGPIVVLDVSCDGGKTILAQRVVTRSDVSASEEYSDIALPFVNDRPANRLEFRIAAVGNAPLACDRIQVCPDIKTWFRTKID